LHVAVLRTALSSQVEVAVLIDGFQASHIRAMEGLDGHDFVLVERNDYNDETGRSPEIIATIQK